jgi:hypothetical protein
VTFGGALFICNSNWNPVVAQLCSSHVPVDFERRGNPSKKAAKRAGMWYYTRAVKSPHVRAKKGEKREIEKDFWAAVIFWRRFFFLP